MLTGPGTVDAEDVTADDRRGLAALRQEATDAAAEIRRAAADAAEELRERSRADADRLRAEARADADRTLAVARAEIADMRAGLKDERERLAREAAASVAAERADLAAAQQRLREQAAALEADRRELSVERTRARAAQDEVDRERTALDRRDDALQQQAGDLTEQLQQLRRREAELDQADHRVQAELVRVSGLTVADARAELLAAQQDAVRRDAALLIRRVESEARTEAKSRARAIVAEAVQRVASDQTAQTVVSVMQLPSDDIKGRIIGREGRNIRAFETVTGVNVIIDDTPEAVLLSCFDPVRREVGRVTLQMLIDDGRIHPHRIEEAFERATDEVHALCRRAAEDALLQVGITDLHPELVEYLGRLKYRTSYGQNVLGHLIETSHIARMMAAELGADEQLAARGAFLHDIGKALTHEAQGSHALVGAELARKYGESEAVAHCIEAHHDEVPPSTVEAVLTQAADACSGGRPGARRESLEAYVQRLERIEAIASGKKGVEKVFAMQAGRELRVMVKPEVVDDLEAHVLAREVAKQIEEELTYPGQVRVTVIRESRATEIAR
ncbi:ribonuclease Y [Nakamurella endophytica]|uniref:ribonuclease Y n=1 Tax=Nakamurella endophytica TaxID=1748367 RepID=UPI003570E8EC